MTQNSDDRRTGGAVTAAVSATEERGGPDRRQSVADRRSGLERRRGAGIRRSEDRRSAEEGEFTEEQFAFVQAMDEYKRVNRRPFPTWTEVLDVVKYLGYRKVADRGEQLGRPNEE